MIVGYYQSMCASAQISYSLFAQRPSRVLQGFSCVLLKLPRALLAAATSRPFRQAGFSHLNYETAWSRPAGGNLQRILCSARPLAYQLPGLSPNASERIWFQPTWHQIDLNNLRGPQPMFRVSSSICAGHAERPTNAGSCYLQAICRRMPSFGDGSAG